MDSVPPFQRLSSEITTRMCKLLVIFSPFFKSMKVFKVTREDDKTACVSYQIKLNIAEGQTVKKFHSRKLYYNFNKLWRKISVNKTPQRAKLLPSRGCRRYCTYIPVFNSRLILFPKDISCGQISISASL